MNLAERHTEMERRLDQNPDLRKRYEEITMRMSEANGGISTETKQKEQSNQSPDWLRSGPPPPPSPTSDSTVDASHKDAYEKRLIQHKDFLRSVNEKLSEDKELKKQVKKNTGASHRKATGQISYSRPR